MDKYEYKLKTEQMLELMEDGAYRKAADLADSIDWRRVRNVAMLTNVSDIYAKMGNYEKSYEILNMAYRRAEGSRKIISRMCDLALKTGNISEAEEYYDAFVRIAPKDPNQFILRYQILRARKEPVEQQIEALEEYKKSEYIEQWAFELAKLYEEAGMTQECLEECDDLILWFSEGEYVYQAMELKKQYKPLTPSQQEKYNSRYDKSATDTEEMPNITAYVENVDLSLEQTKSLDPEETSGAGTTTETSEESRSKETADAMDSDMKIVSPEKKKIGSTMRLDEALRQLLSPKKKTKDAPEENGGLEESEEAQAASEGLPEEAEVLPDEVCEGPEAEQGLEDTVEDLTDLETEIEQIESVADLDMVKRISDGANVVRAKSAGKVSVSSDMKEIIPDYDEDEETSDDQEQKAEDAASAEPVNLNIADEEEPAEDSEGDSTETSDEEVQSDEEERAEKPARESEEVSEETVQPDEEARAEESEEASDEEVQLDEEESTEEPVRESEEGSDEAVQPDEEESAEEPVRESEEGSDEAVQPDEEERAEEPAGESEEDSDEAVQQDEEETAQSEETELSAEDAEDFEEWEEESEYHIIEGDAAEQIMEEDNKKTEHILPPDIQRLIDEIEGIIPSEEADHKAAETPEEKPVKNMGKIADELRIDNADEFDDEEELLPSGINEEDLVSSLADLEQYFDEEDRLGDEYLTSPAEDNLSYGEETAPVEEEKSGEEEDFGKAGDLEEEDYFGEAEDLEEEDYFGEAEDLEEDYFGEGEELEEEDYFGEAEDLEEDFFGEGEELEEEDYFGEGEDIEDYFGEAEDLDEEDYFSDAEVEEDYAPNLEEEFRYRPEHNGGMDDREIPDDDDGIDIMSATTPLSRKETAKLIATGKTSPLPLNEISDALSMSDTGFIVHGRYDLETQSGIGTRAGLTEEQKQLFSYFVPVRGMSEQLVDVLEQDKNCTNRQGTSRTGNLLIIGNKGSGKTVLAVDVVKAIQKQRSIRQGKVAIVTGESLNKKKISDIFNKLYGGALIIEKAGSMNEKTLSRLNKAMEKDTGELLVVLEEQRKPLDRLLTSNREFRRKFTSRLEVPIFINDELVTFGQTYAQENGYRIDEMGILALYSRIDSLQREDHAVSVAEVKDIMDEAIAHSQKASAKKLMKRVFGRSTDDTDRIILSERDFNI